MYEPTKLKEGARCRPVVASMAPGAPLSVQNSVTSGNLMSYDNGGVKTMLRVQMDSPGSDFSSAEDFYVGGTQWSGMIISSCSQMNLKDNGYFEVGGGPKNDSVFSLPLTVTDGGWMGSAPISVLGQLILTILDANDPPKFNPETRPMCSYVRTVPEHTQSPLNNNLPIVFSEVGSNRLVVEDPDVSTANQTITYSLLSQNGNQLVNKFFRFAKISA